MAALPTKITAQETVAIDLVGRRFRSREGRSQLRGVVHGITLHEGLVTVSVGSIQGQQGSTWNPLPDFEYQGKEDITTIRRAASGRITIDIMHICSIVIFPLDA